jgi:hypothetical protein
MLNFRKVVVQDKGCRISFLGGLEGQKLKGSCDKFVNK